MERGKGQASQAERRSQTLPLRNERGAKGACPLGAVKFFEKAIKEALRHRGGKVNLWAGKVNRLSSLISADGGKRVDLWSPASVSPRPLW